MLDERDGRGHLLFFNFNLGKKGVVIEEGSFGEHRILEKLFVVH